MPLYNVLVGVVDVVDAPTGKEAIQRMEKRLQDAGFETYGDGTDQLPHAFESEEQA